LAILVYYFNDREIPHLSPGKTLYLPEDSKQVNHCFCETHRIEFHDQNCGKHGKPHLYCPSGRRFGMRKLAYMTRYIETNNNSETPPTLSSNQVIQE
jgi:hypothetical protein